MKTYYYFLFRIFRFYCDKKKGRNVDALMSASVISATVISINLLTLYLLLEYFDLTNYTLDKNHQVIIIMLVIGFTNHFLFVKEKRFLNYNFKKDLKGGYMLISYLIFTFLFAFTVAQFNREKLFRENASKRFDAPRKESLEGKIRKWFER